MRSLSVTMHRISWRRNDDGVGPMFYINVICDNWGCIGRRYRSQIGLHITHPQYGLCTSSFQCTVCGAKLRVAGLREYHARVIKGADNVA